MNLLRILHRRNIKCLAARRVEHLPASQRHNSFLTTSCWLLRPDWRERVPATPLRTSRVIDIAVFSGITHITFSQSVPPPQGLHLKDRRFRGPVALLIRRRRRHFRETHHPDHILTKRPPLEVYHDRGAVAHFTFCRRRHFREHITHESLLEAHGVYGAVAHLTRRRRRHFCVTHHPCDTFTKHPRRRRNARSRPMMPSALLRNRDVADVPFFRDAHFHTDLAYTTHGIDEDLAGHEGRRLV
ncbi:hypothetical protein C8R43DRAFT_1127692 [Mycena crocata]|nr:hypothetical protein C8R43DRAFT_1127692 [Mycena crocata]